MEELKAAIPESLRRMVASSTTNDLPSASSYLLDFFQTLPRFHQMIRELSNPEMGLCSKNKDAAMELKQKGNQYYQNEDYSNALSCYSKALRTAPQDADDMGRNLVATLYQNRASLLHKMGLLRECLRDCNRAVQIYPTYSKAWYRRGKANASLGNFKDAVHDLNVAKDVELSLCGKRQIESELKIILDQCEGTACTLVQHIEHNQGSLDELQNTKLQHVWSPDKGRGIAAKCDIPQASLVHMEEPYAVIILKQCRETRCHYCLNELPVDTVPCTSCSIPLYCSQKCQGQAGGQTSSSYHRRYGFHDDNLNKIKDYIDEITSSNDDNPDIKCFPEHKHECQGVPWPAILPSDIVLAGRVLAKQMVQRRGSLEVTDLTENLELSHTYAQMTPERKLDLLIYSIVLLCCLQHSYYYESLLNGGSIAKIVLLVSQIKVNSMAISCMKFSDVHGLPDDFGNFPTSNVEQVRVGQAIYKAASLFNHSCQPNIHAYFLSRTLLVRTTEFVAAGCPLELSYGPQVGQWDCKDRLQFLEDKYYFLCQCRGCSEVNIADLSLNAFRCLNQNCLGIVLDSSVVDNERPKLMQLAEAPKMRCLEPNLQVGKLNADVNEVLHLAFEERNSSAEIDPGYCLNCGSYRDLESSHLVVSKAWDCVRSLQDAIVSREISSKTLSAALRSLGVLKSILHVYNKAIAEAEDNLAQAFCLVGDLQSARDHCQASIEILKRLYDPHHIVIAYELLKLSSIQLSLGDPMAVDSINQLGVIFLQHYGSHADVIFPYLQSLKREAGQFVQ